MEWGHGLSSSKVQEDGVHRKSKYSLFFRVELDALLIDIKDVDILCTTKPQATKLSIEYLVTTHSSWHFGINQCFELF